MVGKSNTQKKTAKFFNNILNIRIRELMEERKIKTDDLAKALSVSSEAVRLWCSGYARPDIDKILNICNFFDVSGDYLLGLSEFRNSIAVEQHNANSKRMTEHLNYLLRQKKIEKRIQHIIENITISVLTLENEAEYTNKYINTLKTITDYLELLTKYIITTAPEKIREGYKENAYHHLFHMSERKTTIDRAVEYYYESVRDSFLTAIGLPASTGAEEDGDN